MNETAHLGHLPCHRLTHEASPQRGHQDRRHRHKRKTRSGNAARPKAEVRHSSAQQVLSFLRG